MQKGIFDKATATSFRKNVLEKGGSEEPMELYRRFRGSDPDSGALLRGRGGVLCTSVTLDYLSFAYFAARVLNSLSATLDFDFQ